jgi:hypothetical protein
MALEHIDHDDQAAAAKGCINGCLITFVAAVVLAVIITAWIRFG